ncbi:putative dehydrogenase [Thermus oshimai JL-2]|uniref:Putative dehydrogenase n=1 Tax=Thermus oshimai JL-2 TaxID=751945 RepID=K7R5Y6_THEOS|nr:Gfo/Idh/MocA family oxidoreductase [Thermus oshimai]AFV76329.1 putative dehydrogenase [Thermus oshimai JL-2]
MVRLGLVGAGWWAREVHGPAFYGAGAQIVGVYAAGSSRAIALAEAYGARVYDDYEQLLEHVDAVAISTPDAFHVPLALKAVEHNRHVFLEKPVGVSLQEAVQLLQRVEARGIVAMTALTSRADWAAESALGYLGRLGTIIAFRGAFLADYLADPGAPIPWRARLSGGGPAGVVGDLGAHLFDLATWLLGRRLEEVQAHVAISFPGRENPDLAGILVRTGQVYGVLELSRVHPIRPQNLFLELEGERGALRVVPALAGKAADGALFFSKRPGSWEPLPLDPALLRGRDPEEPWGLFHFRELARRFVAAVKEGSTPSPSLRDGVVAQAVIQAVLESANLRSWREVSDV